MSALRKENTAMENNSELQVQLRKNQNTLVVIGLGVIAFGIWSVIKSVLLNVFSGQPLEGISEEETAVKVIFWILLVGSLAIDLRLRFYVGLSAINEGRGRKKRKAYIVWAFFMAFMSALAVVAGLATIRYSEAIGTMIVMIVVETTSCVLLVEMALAALKVKKLCRKLEEREA